MTLAQTIFFFIGVWVSTLAVAGMTWFALEELVAHRRRHR